jgi:glyceraldehyde 3-phosphate dehydrogenase
MIDLTVSTEKPTSLAEIMSKFRVAAKSEMAGVLRVTDEQLVSSDYNGSPYSAIIDAPACAELNPQVWSGPHVGKVQCANFSTVFQDHGVV